MENKLIDLITNLRIFYDKSIEIQLFKELLQTKFLCPISIDDQQNLTINSVVDSNDLNFLPLYIKETDIKGKDRELEYLEISIKNATDLVIRLKKFSGVSINPRTTNFNIRLDDLKNIIESFSEDSVEIISEISNEPIFEKLEKFVDVFKKFKVIDRVFLLKIRKATETNFHWLFVIDCLEFNLIITQFSREASSLFPKNEIIDFLQLKTDFSYDITRDVLPIYERRL